MIEFKEGDRVFINETSIHSTGTFRNPMDVVGTITNILSEVCLDNYSLEVRWDNGSDNIYRPLDLELEEDPKEYLDSEVI